MGCSSSKGVDSPVKRSKEGWESVLPKEFSMHMDRSVKSTEVGYITAIFSANYSNMRMNSQARSDDLSIAIQPSGVSHLNKVSKAAGADVAGNRAWSDSKCEGLLRKACPEMRVGISKPASESNKQAAKVTRPREEPPETINTWELMQGLEDDAEMASLSSRRPLSTAAASHFAAMDETKQALASGERYTSISMPVSPSSSRFLVSTSSPSPSLAAAIGGIAVSPARPKSFTSIRCIEDDAHVASRSRIAPAVWPENQTRTQPIRYHERDRWRQTKDTYSPTSSPPDALLSAGEEAISHVPRDPSDWSPNNLQRALSFKYIFNNDSSECHDTPDNGSAGSDRKRSDKTPSTYEFGVCLTGSTEQDCHSYRPSPEFSGAASLKEWLPVFGSLNQSDAAQTGARRSLLGALEDCSNSAMDSVLLQSEDLASHRRNSERVHSVVSKCGRSNGQLLEHTSTSDSNCLLPKRGCADDNLQENAATTRSNGQAPTRYSCNTEENESPVFCPKPLESFENAPKNLLESWYSVTSLGSESESPRDLLRLLESLRRTSSDSMDGINTVALEGESTATLFEKKIMDANLENATGSKPVKDRSSKIHTGGELSTTKDTGETKKFSSERRVGDERIVLYSTTGQSNAQAYEDCTIVKSILLSLGTSFDERNISVHAEYEQELEMPAVVPTLRVNGRCFVGLDGILQLHRKGMLGALLREAECGENLRIRTACLCRGGKFLICPSCKGRRKVGSSACRNCSGTGLIKCPNCSSF